VKKIKLGDWVLHSGGVFKVVAINAKKKMFRIKDFGIDFLQEDFVYSKHHESWGKLYDNRTNREKKDGWKFCSCED
jgi:hypothetical protein